MARTNNIGRLFGREIGQTWNDLEVWEIVLNEFPEDHFQWIIELGTFEGGMSFYLYAQAWARRMRFFTVDKKNPRNFVPCFTNTDIRKGLPAHWKFHMESPGILFCDNGNKPAEVYHYHNSLHRESLLAVHDWGTEFKQSDIPSDLRVYRSAPSTVFLARNDYLNELESSHCPSE
jgi:hypothetical protein